jgi:hypothetical protein
MIVTSQPDVACDVCERRLLRGEQPDVFLAGGRRRIVCDLCAPRASHEGWLRETDNHSLSLPPPRARRGRNLLDRLRQLRDPVESAGEAEFTPAAAADGRGTSYDFFDGGPGADDGSEIGQALPIAGAQPPTALAEPATPAPGGSPPAGVVRSGDLKAQRAIEVFNAGEHPRRVAGVARSLGAPSVTVYPLAEAAGAVAIVIAWELSWYRYEVDLGDEVSGASVVAQGTELSELAAEERLANAAADADGVLSLVESVVR